MERVDEVRYLLLLPPPCSPHALSASAVWEQISKQRRRVNVSYDLSMVTALQHGTWMDEEGFKKTCIKEKKKRGGIHQRYMSSRFHDETGCRKVYAGETSE